MSDNPVFLLIKYSYNRFVSNIIYNRIEACNEIMRLDLQTGFVLVRFLLSCKIIKACSKFKICLRENTIFVELKVQTKKLIENKFMS